jgi:hypothetical protein
VAAVAVSPCQAIRTVSTILLLMWRSDVLIEMTPSTAIGGHADVLGIGVAKARWDDGQEETL